ncbi:MAG: hypothetical protein R2729_01875 [Bryobacteraceae bacterium]
MRKELGGRPGVLELAFYVVKSKTVVTLDPAVVGNREIEEANRAGMRCEEWSAERKRTRGGGW